MRALDLVGRARAVRQETAVDSAFRSYRGQARGYVYFFIDRPPSEERALVKADQIALELFWRAPDQTKQRIVGLRDQKLLPTNIRYHLDHLTVVQDEFADVIRLGDGDEVSAVVHPAAPGSEAVYDFRLSDSLTISFPGGASADVRVYEVQVRPKDLGAPGFLGSLFLDQSTGAIVRMSFTFTPASYVDPYLDYIRISLDNALWEGKYWLPYRQEAELRRELPQLDFLAGSVIRGRFEVGDYQFNVELPDAFFRTARVTSVPVEQREAFPFEDPLLAQVQEEGLSPPPSLEEIRRQAREIVANRYLSGLSRLRLHLPSASHAFRYNRAEGVFLGGGGVLRPIPDVAFQLYAGYGFASRRVSAGVGVTGGNDSPAGFFVRVHELRDLGPLPGMGSVLNSISALVAEEDYTDPWFSTGARLVAPFWTRGPFHLGGAAVWERHRSASLVLEDEDGSFRPVRPIDEGDLIAADLTVAAGAAEASPRLEAAARLGTFEDDAFAALQLRGVWETGGVGQDLELRASARAGLVSARAPSQELFLLGGRGTLLGHPYRASMGDRFWLLDASAARPIWSPWVTGRVFAAAGQAELADRDLPADWSGDGDAGAKASVGLGLGLVWDVLHLDLGRGLGAGGDWGFAVSASRRFQSWM